jgi:glycosyltransferase involved in cell wall biosynthesis
MPVNGIGRKIAAFAVSQWRDLMRLLRPRSRWLIFDYPKIPFIGHSELPRIRFLALLAYALLIVKNRWTRQRIVVLIYDLPLEQQAMTQPAPTRADLEATLRRMRDPRRLSTSDWLLAQIERLLMRNAYRIASLSPMMTEHLIRKHGLRREQFLPRGRNVFAPAYAHMPTVVLPPTLGLNVFYSGDLSQPTAIQNLTRLMQVFADFPESALYLCGRKGEWIIDEAGRRSLCNVKYLGALDPATHDAVAAQCDVGLIVYTAAYFHLVLTAKYSAYVANGLAVLCSDLATLSQVIREDGVGESVPIQEMPVRLARWLREPEIVRPYQEQARRIAPRFSSGTFRQDWFEPLLAESQPPRF